MKEVSPCMSFAGCSTHVVCVFHDGSANNKVSITVKGCERQYDAVCCCHFLHLSLFFFVYRKSREEKKVNEFDKRSGSTFFLYLRGVFCAKRGKKVLSMYEP